MEIHEIKGVFFDCWGTLVRFRKKNNDWYTHALKQHCIHYENYPWNEIDAFAEHFFREFDFSYLNYEIDNIQFLNLITRLFSIQLDCSLDVINHETLDSLDPDPIPGVMEFLSYLNEKGIYHTVLSNTVYRDDDSMRILDRLLPNHGLEFFFSSAEVGVKKPNPLFFQVGANPTGLNLKECMYIGDTFLQDVMGSYKAGFGVSVWLNYAKRKPTDWPKTEGYENISYLEIDGYGSLLKIFKEKE